MQTRLLPLAAAALCWLGTTAALAQPNDAPNLVPGNEAYYFEHPWERYNGPYDHRWYQQRAEDYRQKGYPGAGPGRDLRIGQHIPRDWGQRQNMVDNWRAHQLAAPPRGYAWYQVGADYVLVEQRTGIVAQTRLGRR